MSEMDLIIALLVVTVLVQGLALNRLRQRLGGIDHESAWVAGMVAKITNDLADLRYRVRGLVPEDEQIEGLAYGEEGER